MLLGCDVRRALYPVVFRARSRGGIELPVLDLQHAAFPDEPTNGQQALCTFSQGASTRINSAGLIESRTSGQPPYEYNPSTLASLGWRGHEARTNLLLNSTIDGANLATQSVTVTAAAHTLSFYGTGTVTLSGASTAGPAVGVGAYPNQRVLTFTPSAGSLTLTVTGTVQFANLTLGSTACPHIPTAGSSVLMLASTLQITGSNFTTAFGAAATGTVIVECILSRIGTIFTLRDSDGSDLIGAYLSSPEQLLAFAFSGFSTQANVATWPANVADLRGTPLKIVVAWGPGFIRAAVNGQPPVSATVATNPAGLISYRNAFNDFSGNIPNATYSRQRAFARAFSLAECQAASE